MNGWLGSECSTGVQGGWAVADSRCSPGLRTPHAERAGHVFFFQAEDGIRDLTVTGVQTCALPISGVEVQAGRLLAPPTNGARDPRVAAADLALRARDLWVELERGDVASDVLRGVEDRKSVV